MKTRKVERDKEGDRNRTARNEEKGGRRKKMDEAKEKKNTLIK